MIVMPHHGSLARPFVKKSSVSALLTAPAEPAEAACPPRSAVRAAFAASVAALETEQVVPVAAALALRLGVDGLLQVLGSGHSQLLALEAYHRAGAPAWVAPLIDRRLSPARGTGGTAAERRPALGAQLAARVLAPGSRARALLVVSTSGHTAAVAEAARLARAAGLLTIALTARQEGNPLVAVCDHVLCSGVASTDAAVDVDGTLMAPQSTVAGAVLLHALLAETEARRPERAVLVSVNLEGGVARNRSLLRRYPHLHHP